MIRHLRYNVEDTPPISEAQFDQLLINGKGVRCEVQVETTYLEGEPICSNVSVIANGDPKFMSDLALLIETFCQRKEEN